MSHIMIILHSHSIFNILYSYFYGVGSAVDSIWVSSIGSGCGSGWGSIWVSVAAWATHSPEAVFKSPPHYLIDSNSGLGSYVACSRVSLCFNDSLFQLESDNSLSGKVAKESCYQGLRIDVSSLVLEKELKVSDILTVFQTKVKRLRESVILGYGDVC